MCIKGYNRFMLNTITDIYVWSLRAGLIVAIWFIGMGIVELIRSYKKSS
jgi:hypothetical protein